MSEYFIKAVSFPAPFIGDDSSGYAEGDSAEEALEQFVSEFKHPAGLYSASAWSNADAFHKNKPKIAEWQSNDLQALKRATAGKAGYSYMRISDTQFEIDGEVIEVEDRKSGSLVSI